MGKPWERDWNAPSFSDVEGGSSVNAPAPNTIAGMRMGQLSPDTQTQMLMRDQEQGPAADIALRTGAMVLGGEAIAASGAIPGAIGWAGRAIAGNPKTTGAVIGAIPGALKGDLKSAAAGAAAGAGLPALTSGIAGLLLKKHGAAAASKLLASQFGGDAKAAEKAIVSAAKALSASEKLRVAKIPKSAADAVLKELGWSEGQIAAHAQKLAKGGQEAVEAGVDVSTRLPGVMVSQPPGAPGTVVMPPYRGGAAQSPPSIGPGIPRVPQNDEDLMALLRESVARYQGGPR